MEYKKFINIGQNEKILQEIEGDAYNMSPNPLDRLLGAIERIFAVIFGTRKKVHFVVTDSRVIKLEFQKMFWIFNKSVTAISMVPRSIKSVGYTSIRKWLIFQTWYFIMNSDTESVYIKYKGKGKDLFIAIDNVSNTLETIQTK